MLRKDLLDTIRKVHSGKRCIPPEIAAELADHVTDDALSDREIDVLRSVATGHSNKIIAAQLNVSEATVKGHIEKHISLRGTRPRAR